MKNYEVWLSRTIEYPWTEREPFYLGDVPRGLGTPAYYCVVAEDEEPRLLVYVYSQDAEARIWHQWLVLRLGEGISFISLTPEHRHIINAPSWGWFRHLYPSDEYLFATTSECVYCYDQEAKLVWASEELSRDTLSLSSVQGDIVGISQAPVYGSPYWPAEFTLDRLSGKLLSVQSKPPSGASSTIL